MREQELNRLIDSLIQQEHLPDTYRQTVADVVLPLARDLSQQAGKAAYPLLVGINGAQGTGKSTLSLFLSELLTKAFDCPCARFSLDDIYLTLAEREHLAETIHPLLRTRGVPGTHDLLLGQQVIEQLRSVKAGEHVAIPAFDKASDDRFPHSRWAVVEGPFKVILLEGWCLGAVAEREPDSLDTPINTLEKDEDADGAWRRFVNDRLATDYRDFFGQLDVLIMLKAPSMACVVEWRTLQERKLAQHRNGAPKRGAMESVPPNRIMSDQQVQRFIMHYERITRATLAEMPDRADVVIAVGGDHGLAAPVYRESI
ncbi:hypothetical protein [Marinobacter zhejiangensis]|uniref:D-glycerate 3-kinase n=1 Tax=Marinobacter zhejiangensis TaxID=488535 RepID=A0A1I4NK63_9GAMM|nr:hypothetical protein [Marinobacter zhejiangensis]SFM15861.1 D-glycerate 3-kinase [Marinobacter zhejiangensis]